MMHLMLRLVFFLITVVFIEAQGDESSSVVSPLSKRWIRIDVNGFVQSTIDQAITVIRRGAAVGYNGVVIQDTKMSFYFESFTESNKQLWIDRLRQVINVAQVEYSMHVSLGVLPFGYSEGFLRHDVNLASGHPIRDSPMVVSPQGFLVPVQTANLQNGGFEQVSSSSFAGYDYIDGVFGDTLVQDFSNFKEGAASLRFSINGGQSHARFFQTITVRPFSHYRFTLEFKADSISCDWSAFLVIDPSSDETRFIGHLQEIQPDGTYNERQGLNDYTTDWIKQGIAFNSLELSQVTIVFGLWGPSSGTLWLDDVKVEAVPTLNLLRRDDLPVSLVAGSDEPYVEGADFEPLSDPLLGNDGPYSGLYGILHDPPTIQATPTGRLAIGQQVLFSGHHALPVFSNFQMTASLTTPRIFEIVSDILENVYIDLVPDSFFFEHDEIRTGGWEEQQVGLFSSAGEVLAENLRQCRALALPYNLPVLIWNDMVDPFHNAGGPFYSARVSFEDSWEGLDPSTTIMNWNSGNAANSLQFFHNRGHDQIIAAYYDEDVQSNLNDWVVSGAQAAGVQDQIDGVMFTTWIEDFSKLEEFAEAWWSSKPFVTPGGEGGDDDDSDGDDDDATNPVVYFKLDEISGTTAVDSSGNEHDATVDDGLVWTSDGYNGGGLATDGEGCLRLSHTGDINVGLKGTDFTAAFWFKLTNNGSPTAWLAIARKGDLWNERGFGLFLTPITRQISYSVSTTNHWNEGGTSSREVQVNQWVHITLVKSDGVLSLYLDGAFDSSASLNGDSIGNNGDLYLGKAPTGSNDPVQAVFDEFRLYTRSLSTEEIASIAAPSSSEAPAPSPPVFCFSASSTVMVRGKGVVSLHHLKIGDFVQTTAQGNFERVYSFGHRVLDPADQVEFLQVLPHKLELSPNHMIFVESKGVVPASLLQVGDTFVSDGRAVEFIRKVRSKRGFVSPFTPSGTIMVNGVLSSNYIAFQDSKRLNIGTIETPFSFHWLAHSFQFPHRLWCHWLGAKDVLLDNGYSKWTQGPLHATQWLFRQKPAFIMLVGVPLVSVLVIFRTVEDAFPSHNMSWFAVVLSSIALVALSKCKLKRRCGKVRPGTSAHLGVLHQISQEGLLCGCEARRDV